MDFLDSSSHHYSYHTQVDPQNMVHNTIEVGEPVVLVLVVVSVGYNDHHNHNGKDPQVDPQNMVHNTIQVVVVVGGVYQNHNGMDHHNGMDPHHSIAHNTPHIQMGKTA